MIGPFEAFHLQQAADASQIIQREMKQAVPERDLGYLSTSGNDKHSYT